MKKVILVLALLGTISTVASARVTSASAPVKNIVPAHAG